MKPIATIIAAMLLGAAIASLPGRAQVLGPEVMETIRLEERVDRLEKRVLWLETRAK